MKNYLYLFVIVAFTACQQEPKEKTVTVSFNDPPAELSLFGENVISTAINERDFALSPDGKELLYTISTPKSTFQTIVHSRKISDTEWSVPEVVSFAGEYSDLEPSFSADGGTLYFSSNRPLPGTATKDFNIWKVIRVDDGWSEPENLGPVVNTEADEFYPSVAQNENLYFTAAYPGGVGKEDIQVAAFVDGAYQKPVALDTAVNSALYEFNAFVAPDERYIIFTSYGRKDDTGSGDLYISLKDKNGKWLPAKNLKALNSPQLDYCPFVSPDEKKLFVTSERHQLPVNFKSPDRANYQKITEVVTSPQNGTGNIYWVDFAKVLQSAE